MFCAASYVSRILGNQVKEVLHDLSVEAVKKQQSRHISAQWVSHKEVAMSCVYVTNYMSNERDSEPLAPGKVWFSNLSNIPNHDFSEAKKIHCNRRNDRLI